MSGYDFLSGFLGSLGDQMQQKQLRKQAIEDEDRQYQRKLSFEEAIAASRDRLARRAEERAMKNAAPTSRVFEEDGVQYRADQKWNAKTGAYETYGNKSKILPSVAKTISEDGYNVDIMTNGERIRRGRTDKWLDIQAANQRNANSTAATRYSAELGAQNRGSGGDKEASRIDAIARKSVQDGLVQFNDSGKRKIALARVGLSDDGEEKITERQYIDAVLRNVQDPYNRISPMPGATRLNEDGSEEYQPSASPSGEAKPRRSNPRFDAKWPELHKKFPSLNYDRLLELFEQQERGQ